MANTQRHSYGHQAVEYRNEDGGVVPARAAACELAGIRRTNYDQVLGFLLYVLCIWKPFLFSICDPNLPAAGNASPSVGSEAISNLNLL